MESTNYVIVPERSLQIPEEERSRLALSPLQAAVLLGTVFLYGVHVGRNREIKQRLQSARDSFNLSSTTRLKRQRPSSASSETQSKT